MPQQKSHWSEDRIEQMKHLILDHSYGMAAAIMGPPFTRSSLIGKAKRLGLTTPDGQKRSYPKHHAQTCPFGVARTSSRAPRKPRPAVVRGPKPTEPELFGEPNTFSAAGQCKFIFGDPSRPGWAMCGHETGNPSDPWCPYHHMVVFVQKPLPAETEAA